MNFDEINGKTGFANGEKFTSYAQVMDYFTVENITMMFGECVLTPQELSEMGTLVIINKCHSEF